MTQITNQGQVKSLTLPDFWNEQKIENSTFHGPEYRTFTKMGQTDCQLQFYFRGIPLNKQSADAFKSILSGAAPHSLSKSEFESIDMVIREMCMPNLFVISSLRTDYLRGKMILVAEGMWKETQLYDLALFINADGDGEIVQEIHYRGNETNYNQNRAEVLKLLGSIEWL